MIQMVQKKKLQWIIFDLKLDAQRSRYEVNKQQEMVVFKTIYYSIFILVNNILYVCL